ncbi:LysR family transcriptional regulator [Streptomyces sp. VRA16 Mangrove soil]|uniref:LysR family transcriptional regulator n=1 Tax=Streptomyces sp. VRA16 Mangrove soil TaxID=2817434 RepID=UPI001A9EF13B|nr:LysR family transcriptional regulator [Streptomyces sp. VRA16 Mangrove soil]
MDLEAVRTFVTVADEGQFKVAAAELGVTQQAASKRVAVLERELGVRLFTRTPRGARLTLDGEAFLPHARAVLRAVERAETFVRSGRRALRVDVLGKGVITTGLLRDFHEVHPDVGLDMATLGGGRAALAAVRDGSVDASFWACGVPREQWPAGVRSERVVDEQLLLAVGAAHPLADADSVGLTELAGYRIWMPGLVEGSEWGAYYGELAREFGLDIYSDGLHFGSGHLLETVAGSASVATFVGHRSPLVRPAGLDLRMVPVLHPTPVYPHSLLWRDDNPHPGLGALREYLVRAYRAAPVPDRWLPRWADRGAAAPRSARHQMRDNRT